MFSLIERAQHDRPTGAAICTSEAAKYKVSSQWPSMTSVEQANRSPKLIDNDPYVPETTSAIDLTIVQPFQASCQIRAT